MNTYEINQVWGNKLNTATITAVDTSYDDNYIRYTTEGRSCATNAKVFAVQFPTEVGAADVPRDSYSMPMQEPADGTPSVLVE